MLNGRKIFITNGVRADFILLVAKTDPAKGHRGISLFFVDRQTPGFTVSRKRNVYRESEKTGPAHLGIPHSGLSPGGGQIFSLQPAGVSRGSAIPFLGLVQTICLYGYMISLENLPFLSKT